MKNIFLIFFASFGLVACTKDSVLEISRDNLIDKIKGGWAGQAIGVVFGGDTEFQYLGTFIQDYQRIRDWEKGIVGKTMQYNPGLFDDIYMDLTFVDVIEREGLDAPQSSFAKRFAEAEKYLRKTLELYPSHRKALNNLGVLLIRMGKPAESVNFFEQAVRIEPGNTRLQVNLAAALAMSGKINEARTMLERILFKEPDCLPARRLFEQISRK